MLGCSGIISADIVELQTKDSKLADGLNSDEVIADKSRSVLLDIFKIHTLSSGFAEDTSIEDVFPETDDFFKD